jgi:hypothetical protein
MSCQWAKIVRKHDTTAEIHLPIYKPVGVMVVTTTTTIITITTSNIIVIATTIITTTTKTRI